jgi:iron complex transport system permease protein
MLTLYNGILFYHQSIMLLRLLCLCLVLLLLLAVNVCCGDVTLAPDQILATLTGGSGSDSTISSIIWQLRLPRLLIAATVGACLSLAGFVMQTISRNSLADPYLTGVSSGAGLAVALAFIMRVDLAFVPLFAFAGGLAVSVIVARLAQTNNGLSVNRLLLGGIGVAAITGGAMTLMLTMNPVFSQTQGIFFWLAGGISGRGWAEFWPAFFCTMAGITAVLVLSKPLRLLSLGPNAAQSLGLNVPAMQWSLLISAVLLCAAAVSVSGLVGFVGLIGPHITRKLFGNNERLQIICATIIGACLVLLSDLVARTLYHGQELPLGTLLAICGGPFFLWLVYQHKEQES